MPWSRGQRAQLVTYRQEPTAAPRCLSFWYRLAGPQIGTQPRGILLGMPQPGSAPLGTAGSPRGAGWLTGTHLCPGTLNLKLRLEGAEETVLWTQRGTQGSVWHRGRATLPATGRRWYRVRTRSPPVPPGAGGAQGHLTPLSRWQVAFEALQDGFLGDMALDDLALTAGPCGAELSCSFEADACGLVASGQHTWLWQSNGTGTTAGPPADHTTGTAAGTGAMASWGSRGALLPALPAVSVLPAFPALPVCSVS